MKSSKILLAGIVLVVAFGLAGYGTVQKLSLIHIFQDTADGGAFHASEKSIGDNESHKEKGGQKRRQPEKGGNNLYARQ